VRARRP
jgi:hypothetical protein